MSAQSKNYTATMRFSSSAPRIWGLLTDFGDTRIYKSYMRAALSPAQGGGFAGSFYLYDLRFDASFAPYDIRLNSPALRIGLTLQPAPDGCRALMVASNGGDAAFPVDGEQLSAFLGSLKAAAGEPVRDGELRLDETVAAPAPAHAVQREAARADAAPAPAPAPAAPIAAENRRRPRSARFGARRIAAVLLLLVLVAGGVFACRKLGASAAQGGAAQQWAGSDALTADAAFSLALGAEKREIEAQFGAASETSGSVSLYRSNAKNAYGDAAVQLQVVYENGKAARICALDLTEATKLGAVTAQSLSCDANATAASLAVQAGTGVSLLRRYYDGAVAVTEYHFGYLDPRASFDPAWQGQLYAVQRADGVCSTGRGYAYDGADPLFCSSLAGSPLAAQYDALGDYLADFYEYQKCLEMTAQYSRGDCENLFGALAETGSLDDTFFYRANSACTLADGETPAWNYTVGLGTRGNFVLFSGVNTRLWQKEGQLEGRPLSAVGVGMNYRDATGTVGLMPSAVYIDYSYLLLGYGAFRPDAASQTEQFEFMVRIRLSDRTVDAVYDNSERVIDIA